MEMQVTILFATRVSMGHCQCEIQERAWQQRKKAKWGEAFARHNWCCCCRCCLLFSMCSSFAVAICLRCMFCILDGCCRRLNCSFGLFASCLRLAAGFLRAFNFGFGCSLSNCCLSWWLREVTLFLKLLLNQRSYYKFSCVYLYHRPFTTYSQFFVIKIINRTEPSHSKSPVYLRIGLCPVIRRIAILSCWKV